MHPIQRVVNRFRRNKPLRRALRFSACLILALRGHSHGQVTIPRDFHTPSTGSGVVRITETDGRSLVTRVRGYDGTNGRLLYDTAAPKFWTWTRKADHHRAVVRVTQNGAAGSGALVWSDGKRGLIATAAHVASSGTGKCTWPSGHESGFQVAGADRSADVSLLWVNPPNDAEVIPISRIDPKVGEHVEHCGYGGPGNNLRHFWATVRTYATNQRMETNCYLLNGDSGGPVIYKGRIVGVNSAGTHLKHVGVGGGGWPLHSPAITCGPTPLRRLFTQCRPQSSPGRGGSVGPSFFPSPTPDPFVPDAAGPPPADGIEHEAEDWRPRMEKVESGLAEANTQLSKVAESTKQTNDQLSAIQQQIDQLANRIDSSPPSPVTPDQVQQVLSLIQQNQSAIASIQTALEAKPEPPPVVDTNDDKQRLENLILYYTSRSCTKCKDLDDKIAKLKQEGWPIVVTRVSPQEAQVSGVPRVFLPSTNKHVVGISNCTVYLNSLIR